MPLAGPVFLRAGLAAPIRLSSAPGGIDGNGASQNARFSPDGRSVLFESLARNLVGGDSNGLADLFVANLDTGAISRVSTTASGQQITGASGDARWDASGTRIVFDSTASDLILSGDTNGARDVYVKGLASGTVTLVSSSAAGLIGNGDSINGVFSSDGTRVAFESLATNLIGADTNRARDVFIKDLASGQLTRVSTDKDGGEANGQSADVDWSPDGTKIVFASNASNLVADDTNAAYDIFVKDLLTGAITRISTDANALQANGHSFHAHFSADGRAVVFESLASNLVAGDTNGARDIFSKDLATGAVTRLSTDLAGGQALGSSYGPVQANGWTAFESNADLTGGDSNARRDIYLHDDLGDGTLRVSLGAGGAQPNADVFNPVLAGDGSAILFESAASNVAGTDANGVRDIFLARLVASVTSGAVTQDGTAATGSIFFDDGAPAAAHRVSVVAPPDALGGFTASLALDSSGAGAGRIDWRFAGTGFDALGAGQTLSQSFGVVLDDGAGHSATQQITVALTGINDAPLAVADALELDAGNTLADLAATLLGNDRDVDRGDRLSIAGIDTSGTLGLVTFDPATGALAYSADTDALRSLTLGETLTDHFVYTARDLAGATSQADVTVTVQGVAPPPSDAADVLRAAATGDLLDGLGGDDTLYGGPGDDTLVGGSGNDQMIGGAGDDVYSVDSVGDVVLEAAGEGHDAVVADIDYTLPLYVEDLVLVGGDLNGTGNALDNRLSGTDGANVLDGGPGADWLAGKGGADVYLIDNIGDVAIELPGEGTDLVRTTLANYTLPENVENLVFESVANAAGTGNALDNMIRGSDGNDLLAGLGGNDYLTGGAGADVLDGGAGADQLRGGAGADTFVLRPGETQGDQILDFNTSSSGDTLVLQGWGAGTTVTATGSGDWAIHDGVDGHVETLRIIGDLHPADIVFG